MKTQGELLEELQRLRARARKRIEELRTGRDLVVAERNVLRRFRKRVREIARPTDLTQSTVRTLLRQSLLEAKEALVATRTNRRKL